MRINIVAVGKIKESYFTEAINEYKKRLSKFCTFSIIEVEELSSVTSLERKMQEEGKLILEKCEGDIVCLDRRGKMLSSEEIASYIDLKKLSGQSKITFVIGGSNGLSDEVLSRASLVISFGKITYPHQLFRVILMEQIYRAFSISSGLPYHK